jgi:hypothetical protein
MKRKRGVVSVHEPQLPIRVIVDKGNDHLDKIVPASVVRQLYREHILTYDHNLDMYMCPEPGLVPDLLRPYPSAGSRIAQAMIKTSRLVRGTVVYTKKKRKRGDSET